jgi:anti-sigma factor RsiW
MSDVLRLAESECARARISMAGLVDGDLAADQSAWLRGHLESCSACRAVLAGFVEIDRGVTAWGQRLGQENPPPAGAREQLAARLGSRPARRRASRWIPAAAAALAAALALAAIVRHATLRPGIVPGS